MFLFNLSSLEIGLLAGGGAVLLAVIVVLILLLCRHCGNKGKTVPKSPRQKRRLSQSGHYHSTIDLPPLVFMDGVGTSKTSIMGMVDNPLKTHPSEEDDTPRGCAVATLNGTEWKSFDSLGVPRSPREFMYYMRTLEQSRNSPALQKKVVDDHPTLESENGVYDIKIFSSNYRESSSRNGKGQAKQESPSGRRNTSGALRHPAYREMMQGNSFHVVCTTPCTDMSDSDSEPEFSSPKARLKFTTILEEQSGSTASALNVIARTEIPPTYHESKASANNLQALVNDRL